MKLYCTLHNTYDQTQMPVTPIVTTYSKHATFSFNIFFFMQLFNSQRDPEQYIAVNTCK